MMIIEKLKINDIPQVLELYKTLVPFSFSLDNSFDTYQKMLANQNYCLIVAKEDDNIIGTVLGICCESLFTPFLVIEDFIVKEGLRGKGVGRKLIETLDNFAKENKCSYAILVSSGYRKEAHTFYEKVGFTEDVKGFRKIY